MTRHIRSTSFITHKRSTRCVSRRRGAYGVPPFTTLTSHGRDVFDEVERLTIEGLTLRDSPNHHIELSGVVGARLRRLTIDAPYHSPNTDGVNFYGGWDSLLEDAVVDNGDDCVSVVPIGLDAPDYCARANTTDLKCARGGYPRSSATAGPSNAGGGEDRRSSSTRDARPPPRLSSSTCDARLPLSPSRCSGGHVVVRNVTCNGGHGLSIGGVRHGNVRNVTFENITATGGQARRARRFFARARPVGGAVLFCSGDRRLPGLIKPTEA